jgi:hypothetical protein
MLFFYFLFKKLSALVPHTLVSGRHQRHLEGAWEASWWPNLAIHRLDRCANVPYFTWCDACKHIIVGLHRWSIVKIFSFFYLSWQLKYTILLYLFIVCFGLASMPDPSYLVLGITPDPRTLGLVTMLGPRALDLHVWCYTRVWVGSHVWPQTHNSWIWYNR